MISEWRASLSKKKTPAAVCPVDDHMGLDIARILSSLGITVYGFDHSYNIPGRFSKYLKFIYCPYPENQEEQYIGFLNEFAHSLDEKPVLFPLSDDLVYIISKFRSQLGSSYNLVIPEHSLVEKLINKDGLYYLACQHSVLAPRTYFVKNEKDLDLIKKENIFPLIIKPEASSFWYSEKATLILRRGLFSARPKVIYCQNFQQLQKAYDKIAAIDRRVVVQEVIPGDEPNLVYVAFYCNNQSDLLGYFSGRKIRVIPKGFGSASFVRSYDDPALRTIVTKFLEAIEYKGLGGIEFKKDIRDNVYKIIEFNPRFGMWDALGARCGVNLPYIAYCDALGIKVKRQLEFRENVIWVDWQRDIRAFLEYHRAGQLSFLKWLKSLRGEKVVPIFSFYDWRPGAYFTLSLILRLWQRTLRVISSAAQMKKPKDF